MERYGQVGRCSLSIFLKNLWFHDKGHKNNNIHIKNLQFINHLNLRGDDHIKRMLEKTETTCEADSTGLAQLLITVLKAMLLPKRHSCISIGCWLPKEISGYMSRIYLRWNKKAHPPKCGKYYTKSTKLSYAKVIS